MAPRAKLIWFYSLGSREAQAKSPHWYSLYLGRNFKTLLETSSTRDFLEYAFRVSSRIDGILRRDSKFPRLETRFESPPNFLKWISLSQSRDFREWGTEVPQGSSEETWLKVICFVMKVNLNEVNFFMNFIAKI